jgi:hypothetical protein
MPSSPKRPKQSRPSLEGVMGVLTSRLSSQVQEKMFRLFRSVSFFLGGKRYGEVAVALY